MEYRMRINLDNAAFGEFPGIELARILRYAADYVDHFGIDQEIRLRDVNGNVVGIAGRVDSNIPFTPELA